MEYQPVKQIENEIYERDYSKREYDPEAERANAIFERAVNGSFFQNYNAAMDAIPKVIVQKDKENYEYLLKRCEEMAKQWHGRIKGVVDYQHWDSHIEVTLPCAEFGNPDELALLREIAEKAHLVTFTSNEEGGITVSIMINYFEELMTEEHRGYLKYKAIMDDGQLATMLNMPTLSPEDEAIAQRIKDILDRFEEETEVDSSTAFRAVMDYMKTQDEEKQTLEYMVAYLEYLLEKVLNGETAE